MRAIRFLSLDSNMSKLRTAKERKAIASFTRVGKKPRMFYCSILRRNLTKEETSSTTLQTTTQMADVTEKVTENRPNVTEKVTEKLRLESACPILNVVAR